MLGCSQKKLLCMLQTIIFSFLLSLLFPFSSNYGSFHNRLVSGQPLSPPSNGNDDNPPPSNVYELPQEIIFVVPALPIFFNLLFKLLSRYSIPYMENIFHFIKIKRFDLPYFESISIGGLVVIITHLVLCIAVGVTTYNNQSSSGNQYRDCMITVTGFLSKMNYWITILPTAKTSIFTNMTGVPFERAVKYHKVVVMLALIVSLIHLLFNNRQNKGEFYSPNITSNGIRPLYGLMAFLIAATMSIFALDPIRKYAYELFFLLHHLYIVVIVFIILHDGFSLNGFIPGIILHGLDQSFKLYSRITAKYVMHAIASKGITTLTLPIDTLAMRYCWDLGGYCFIHIPKVSIREWHPFSISSYSKINKTISFDIKALDEGSFTKKLYDYIQSTSASTSGVTMTKTTKVAIYGPFGNLALNLTNYSDLYMICGGIGITSMLPILDDIMYSDGNDDNDSNIRINTRSDTSANTNINKYMKLKRVCVIWSLRNIDVYERFQHRLQYHLSSPSSSSSSSSPPPLSPSMLSDTFTSGHVDIEMRGVTCSENKDSENKDSENKDLSDFIVSNPLTSDSEHGVGIKPIELRSEELDTIRTIDMIIHTTNTDQSKYSNTIMDTQSYFNKTLFHISSKTGRPNIPEIVSTSKKDMAKKGKVGILLCGPHGMCSEAIHEAIKSNIDFHVETFGY